VDTGTSFVPFLAVTPSGDLDLGEVRLASTACIEGRVVDAAGAPMRAVVRAQPILGAEGPEGEGFAALARATVTDRSGRFILNGLLPREHWVAASSPGLRPGFANADARPLPGGGERGERKPGDLVLRLPAGVPFRGRVVDPQGVPAPGARISLYWKDAPPEVGRFGLTSFAATTDQAGRFLIEGLSPDGSYQLQATLYAGVKVLQTSRFVPSHPDAELEIVLEDR
jgi:hypothetical protein